MTTLLVAANGGHLSQLHELAARIEGLGEDRVWVTFDSAQSRSLLKDEATEFIDPIEERDALGVLRGLKEARRIFHRFAPKSVVSTGSGIALSFLPYAALRGIPSHYIESAARVGAPSLTGRLLQAAPGVRLYRQYPVPRAGRWRYAGSVFDGFRSGEREGPTTVRRIVVTLGSGVHSFRRLVDRLVACLPRDIEVLWQTGSTPVEDLAIKGVEMVPAAAMEAAVRNADAVISHAGCGSALLAMNAGILPILVPREPRNGELVDSHQVELASFLGERGLALHRTPASITFEDVIAAAGRIITRRRDTPAMRLG